MTFLHGAHILIGNQKLGSSQKELWRDLFHYKILGLLQHSDRGTVGLGDTLPPITPWKPDREPVVLSNIWDCEIKRWAQSRKKQPLLQLIFQKPFSEVWFRVCMQPPKSFASIRLHGRVRIYIEEPHFPKNFWNEYCSFLRQKLIAPFINISPNNWLEQKSFFFFLGEPLINWKFQLTITGSSSLLSFYTFFTKGPWPYFVYWAVNVFKTLLTITWQQGMWVWPHWKTWYWLRGLTHLMW